MSIDIPAELVSSGAGVPGVCTRHGEPAVLQKPVKFISKPPGWAWVLIVAGAVPYLIVVLLLRKEVQAPSWPFCARCQKMHKKRMLIGAGLVLPLVLLFVVAVAGPNLTGPAAVWFAFAAIIACVFGLAALTRGSYRLLPQGYVARDGKTVGFPHAHATFVAEAGAAYQRVAQQYAAWQPGQPAHTPSSAAFQAAYTPQQPPQA